MDIILDCAQPADAEGFIDVMSFLLFHGPPGTGKSYLAEASAGEINARLSENQRPYNFLSITSAALCAGCMEEGAERAQALVRCLKRNRPIIAVIEEVNGLARCSSSDDFARNLTHTVGTLWDQLDSIKAIKDICIIGTTSRELEPDSNLQTYFEQRIRFGHLSDTEKISNTIAYHTNCPGYRFSRDIVWPHTSSYYRYVRNANLSHREIKYLVSYAQTNARNGDRDSSGDLIITQRDVDAAWNQLIEQRDRPLIARETWTSIREKLLVGGCLLKIACSLLIIAASLKYLLRNKHNQPVNDTNFKKNIFSNADQQATTRQQTLHTINAHNDPKTDTQEITPEIFGSILNNTHLATNSTIPENSPSLCKIIQANLILKACLAALYFNVSATINATVTYLTINSIVQKSGPILYAQHADQLILQVAELHTIVGAIKATGLDCRYPDIAARLIAGNNNCNLAVVPYLDDTFSNLDPRCYAALRSICASVDTVDEEATLPIETREKIIRAADKISWAINHFVCNDISITMHQNALSFLQAHDASAEAIKDYLCSLITHMDNYNSMPRAADAYHAVRNLGVGCIKTAFSEAEQCVNAEKDIKHYFTIGNELGLGILTMQALEGILKSADDSPEGTEEPLYQPESVEHVSEERNEAEQAALADGYTRAEEEVRPAREQLHPSLARTTWSPRRKTLQLAGLAFVSAASLKYLLSQNKAKAKCSNETTHTEESPALLHE